MLCRLSTKWPCYQLEVLWSYICDWTGSLLVKVIVHIDLKLIRPQKRNCEIRKTKSCPQNASYFVQITLVGGGVAVEGGGGLIQYHDTILPSGSMAFTTHLLIIIVICNGSCFEFLFFSLNKAIMTLPPVYDTVVIKEETVYLIDISLDTLVKYEFYNVLLHFDTLQCYHSLDLPYGDAIDGDPWTPL